MTARTALGFDMLKHGHDMLMRIFGQPSPQVRRDLSMPVICRALKAQTQVPRGFSPLSRVSDWPQIWSSLLTTSLAGLRSSWHISCQLLRLTRPGFKQNPMSSRSAFTLVPYSPRKCERKSCLNAFGWSEMPIDQAARCLPKTAYLFPERLSTTLSYTNLSAGQLQHWQLLQALIIQLHQSSKCRHSSHALCRCMHADV